MSDTERAWDLKKANAVAAWTRGRPQGPVTMEISPTMACNENCMFCRRKDEMKGYYATTTDVDDDKWIAVVSDALEMGTQKILFRGGGEPLLRKSLFMRLFPLRVRYPQAEFLVLTNGTTIDDRLAEGFVRSGWNDLTISLHGGTPAVHDAITDLSGSFERVARSLTLLNAWKDRLGLERPSLNFHVVLTRKSFRDIGPLIEFAREHRVVQIGLFPMHNAPYPQHVHDLEMRPEDEKKYRELLPGYIAAMERHGIRHCVQMSYQGENVELSATAVNAAAALAPAAARKEIDLPCYFPWAHAAITPNGAMAPCCYGENFRRSADLHAVSFREAWLGGDMAEARAEMSAGQLMPYCRQCPNWYQRDNARVRDVFRRGEA